MGEWRWKWNSADYIHINDAVATDGSDIEFQSKTPKFTGASGLTRTGSVGSSRSEGLLWGRDRSGYEWDDDKGFTVGCPVGGLMKRHCLLECTSASLCESLRLRTPCIGTWVRGELTAYSGVSSLNEAFSILRGMEEGKDSGGGDDT